MPSLSRYLRRKPAIYLLFLLLMLVIVSLLFAFKHHSTTLLTPAQFQYVVSEATPTSPHNETSKNQPTHVTPTHETNVKQPSNTSGTVSLAPPTSLPTIFIVTPTYTREVQKAELTKQCQTFSLVDNVQWIVVEDSDEQTQLVSRLLERCPVKSVLLNRKTIKKPRGQSQLKPSNRGAQQRNIGLEWLRQRYSPSETMGVVYFADDDNTYDIQIFNEMRFTKKVSVWPVAFAGGVRAEGPVCKNGRVTGYHSGWAPYPYRKFPLDMAAFAVNLDVILRNPKVKLNVDGTPGFLESNFLSLITTKEELEPKANDCSKVYVWHTETKDPILVYEKKNPTLLEV